MLISYKVCGYKVFNEEVEISFKGNKKIKNKNYVFNINNNEVLKSVIIYGANNTGKSTLIESLRLLKKIIKSGKITNEFISFLDFNFFSKSNCIDFEIEFIECDIRYKYQLSFNKELEITNEVLFIEDKVLFDKNKVNDNKELNNAISLFKSYKNMLIVTALPGIYKKHTDNFNSFFDKLIVLNKYFDFNEVINDTLDLNKKEFNKFNKILKSADISINNIVINNNLNDELKELRMFSEYYMNNYKASIPSYLSDSDGTRVFMYYILKIMKLMKSGGVIVIDEIDRSLHTLLTKNIVSIFNNSDNKNMQLIATSHDLLLLDCLYLFRKDQVWFTYKDDKKVYVYSLDKFKSNVDNQIRNNTMESYLKGMFGSLPHPNIDNDLFDE